MSDLRMDDIVSALDRLEELLEGLSDDRRLLSYARELTRLAAWLRTQPRSRLLMLAGLGAGVLVGLLLVNARRRPEAPGTAPPPILPDVDPEGEEEPS